MVAREPELEPPKFLQRAEVDAALVLLVRDASQMARTLKLARRLAHGLRAMNAEDLLGKAMMLLLAEKRKWKRELSTHQVLKGVMRSVAYCTRKKLDYLLGDEFDTVASNDPEYEPSVLVDGVSLESNPERVVEGASELAVVQNAVKDDEELELLVEALAEGLSGMEIARELGWDGKKYDAARKRFSRRLAMLKTDRS